MCQSYTEWFLSLVLFFLGLPPYSSASRSSFFYPLAKKSFLRALAASGLPSCSSAWIVCLLRQTKQQEKRWRKNTRRYSPYLGLPSGQDQERKVKKPNKQKTNSAWLSGSPFSFLYSEIRDFSEEILLLLCNLAKRISLGQIWDSKEEIKMGNSAYVGHFTKFWLSSSIYLLLFPSCKGVSFSILSRRLAIIS